MSSVSNGLYFLTLPLVSVMRVIYRKIRHARYLYIKRNVEKVWGARYTLGARYLSKNMVILQWLFISHSQGEKKNVLIKEGSCSFQVPSKASLTLQTEFKLIFMLYRF